MAERLPLSALLSQTLVAFTIEFDNEFEHGTLHRTTNHKFSKSAPWLVSMAMWIKFMRFVPDHGLTVDELSRATGRTTKELKLWLTRMSKWWGYVRVKKDPAEDPSKWLIEPTPGGQKALHVWRPLTGIIEERWRERFGQRTIADLCDSLHLLIKQLDANLPDYLPILGYHMLSSTPTPRRQHAPSELPHTLPILLSKVLLALAIEFEQESALSLAITANVLRVVSEEGGTRVRDLPRLSGVSKEAIAMAVKRLLKGGLAAAVEDTRVKAITLTEQGQQARDTYHRTLQELEQRWHTKFGPAVTTLRQSLEDLAQSPLLLSALEPCPDGWRAALPKPELLPHFPMLLHRGGYPDGS